MSIAPEKTKQPTKLKRPEILAPAGTEEMMKAAVENGADAVYFGLQQFNARLRAANFTLEKLPETMAYLHERGVKGYVTMNTLLFPSELEMAKECLIGCSNSGVDAILVQDLGLARLANALVPDLPVHASTQMTVTGPEGIEALEDLGLELERIVAAREMNRREINKMTTAVSHEVEVFVHGAICVAYSGQCLTSEALGGRSANRGECAQACRLPYDLIVDGKVTPVDDLKYLLSPKDLAAYEDIGDLIRSGVVSLKIEGRLKNPQYVAATVQSYRAAVDAVINEHHDPVMDASTEEKLAMTFSRGFTGGYLHETDHQAVVEGRFPKKRGLYLGEVASVQGSRVRVILQGPVKVGDGVVFDAGKPDQDETGGRVYKLYQDNNRVDEIDSRGDFKIVDLEFDPMRTNLKGVETNQRVWKTSDPKLDAMLTSSFAGDKIYFQRPVHAFVKGQVGTPLQLTLKDFEGIEVTVHDDNPAEEALKRPLNDEVLRKQIGRLGGTPFRLETLKAKLIGDLMVPMSRLNELRRKAVEELIGKRRSLHTQRYVHPEAFGELTQIEKTSQEAQTRLSVLCRELSQVRAAVESNVDIIYTDFEDIRLHKEARALIPESGPQFVPASIRVIKPGESGFVKSLLNCDPDGVLVRSLSAWQILKALKPDLKFYGDFSLNISNQITANLIMEKGFQQLVPSYDLNIDQLMELLYASDPNWFEVTIHQYMPMFHMEHCVFCRFLSEGTNYTNCGRPCEEHKVAVKDRLGYEHPVKADAGCRNTVFNATAQSASAYMKRILSSGTNRFRIDFLSEDARQARKIINAYRPVVAGEKDGSELWKELKVSSKLGVTKGSLDHD